MATQKAPDGTEYEYNDQDPVDVARVAALCEPSFEVKRARAKAAFEAAAPEAAKAAQASVTLGAGGFSAADLQAVVSAAVAQAMAAGGVPAAAHSEGTSPAVAESLANTPVADAVTPVEGSQSNA